MIPAIISQKLQQLRRRKRLLHLAWGAARWLALVLVTLLVACLVDFLVDRERDTPWALRVFLFILWLGAAAVGAGFFLVWPLTRRSSDDELALEVEDHYPRLNARLISAVQLNRPDADTQGMSPELIKVVTREAEHEASRLDFAAVADPRRLGWAAGVALPSILVFVLPLVLWPDTFGALLGRQFLADVEVPRNVSLASTTREIWPSGDRVQLTFAVKGKDLKDLAGRVVVRPQGQPTDVFDLELIEERGPEEAIFGVRLPSSSTDFEYTARLGDGRMKAPALVRFVPRPIIIDQQAWVQLPAECGLRPDGRRYEQPQSRGDVAGITGSSVRVRIRTQKAIKSALLTVLGPENFETAKSVDQLGPETTRRKLPMKIIQEPVAEKGQKVDGYFAEVSFDLREGETAYRIDVEDEYGFNNVPAPRRALQLIPEEPPQVGLLKETFPPGNAPLGSGSEDFEVEGMPVPPGGSIRIAYMAAGPYGIGSAKLLYRVLKKLESGNDDPGEEKWIEQPLPESQGTEKTGAFIPSLGVFEKSGPKAQVFFHAVPSLDPELFLPRTLAGGRFDFKTTGIPDGKGGLLTLKVGDQIEFAIEVVSKTGKQIGRSDTRVKTIVSVVEFARWLDETLQEERRIRELDAKQRGLFEGK